MRLLVKLGGAALAEPSALAALRSGLKAWHAQGTEVVVVHGGGPAINSELTARGIDYDFLDGQRVTTPDMMDIIAWTLGEKVNRRIVEFIEPELPVRGASASTERILFCQASRPELGAVGEVREVNVRPIERWLDAGRVPVIAPLGFGADGEALNVNADWAAAHLAVALNVDELIYLTDQDGVLNSVGQAWVKLVDSDVKRMINSGEVTGGMLTKARAIDFARSNGIQKVRVMRGQKLAGNFGLTLDGTVIEK